MKPPYMSSFLTLSKRYQTQVSTPCDHHAIVSENLMILTGAYNHHLLGLMNDVRFSISIIFVWLSTDVHQEVKSDVLVLDTGEYHPIRASSLERFSAWRQPFNSQKHFLLCDHL